MDDIDIETINPGDHVYVWRFGYLYQHHGIIFTSEVDGSMSVAEFYPSCSNDDDKYLPKVRITTLDEFSKSATVHKVEYAARWHSRLFHRPGTTTSSPKDPLPLILSRLQFIVDNQDNISPYNALSSNDECLCVWISTGTYCTLQVCSILQLLSIGNAKVAVTTAAAASMATVAVPASGFWGWFGATTTVPLLTANPLVLPALIGMGLISLVPLEMLRRFQKKWKDTSIELNNNFQQHLEQNTDDYGLYQLPPPMNAFFHDSSKIESSIDIVSLTSNLKDEENENKNKFDNQPYAPVNAHFNDSVKSKYSNGDASAENPNIKVEEITDEENQIILDLIT